MKKILLLCVGIIALHFTGLATVHVVTVSNFQFSPSSMTVFVGDIVRFTWSSGNHTTTCDPSANSGTSLPGGAATWNSPMNSGSTTFDYTVTVAGTYNYVCIPHAPNMAGSFVAQIVTPLKLSSFNIEATNNVPLLTWKTATEENTDHFSVRRSLDGSNFTEIATLPAAGNSLTEKSYRFSDNKLSSDKFFYYKIAIIDKDGKQTLTDTKIYKNTKAITKLILTLSPNPISTPGHLNMTFNAEKEGQMQVQVVSAEGKTIITRSMQAYVGVNRGHIHLGDQPTGTYTLICTMDGVSESHQVVYK